MIQDFDVINFSIFRVQPSIIFLHHVIPKSILLGLTSGASFLGPSIFTFSSMVIHKVHSCDILHNSPYLGPAHIPRLFQEARHQKNHILPFGDGLLPMTSSCRYQHPAYMLTHLPKIPIVKGLIFLDFHQSLHIFSGDFLVNSSWSLDVDCFHHGCIVHDLFLSHTFHSSGFLIRVL